MSEEIIPTISEAINNNDAKALKRITHYFRSSSMQIGATRLSELIIELENFGMNENLKGIKTVHDNFVSHSKEVMSELKKYISNDKAA